MSQPSGRVLGDRALVALIVAMAVALSITVLVALLTWHTPALVPVTVPSVARA